MSTHIAESSRHECELVIFDRLDCCTTKKQSTTGTQYNSVTPLTAMESNAVGYVSGFMAASLLKEYRNPTVEGEAGTLCTSADKAVNQPREPDRVLDYSSLTLWIEVA